MKHDPTHVPVSSATEVSDFLARLKTTPKVQPAGKHGRLIFALDATASREPTWNEARRIQTDMFRTASELGGLAIQLCYYRGYADFVVSDWVNEPERLLRQMEGVECLGGYTRIERVLEQALAETRKQRVDALVFVGDCMEEEVDALCQRAGELGLLGVRAFLFQEGRNPDAERAFRQIAQLTRGAFCRFDAGSARELRELLMAVATYAAGGMAALKQLGRDRGGLSLQLSRQLES